MAVMVTLEFPLITQKADEMINILKSALVETRKYDGCVSVDSFVQECGGNLILIEHWESKLKQEAYLKWRMDTGLIETIQPFLKSPLVIKYYKKI